MRRVHALAVPFLFSLAAAMDYPGAPPGPARATCSPTAATLENDAVSLRWIFHGGSARPGRMSLGQASSGVSFANAECFSFAVERTPGASPLRLTASGLKLAGPVARKRLQPATSSLKKGDGFGGWELSAKFVSTEPAIEVFWRAVLRDGANYVRQYLEIRADQTPLELSNLVLLELAAPHAEAAGNVDGSPVLAGNVFAALEHPMSRNQVTKGADGSSLVRCSYPYQVLVRPQHPRVFSSVIGVVPEGQTRRGFLHYLERERPQPYHIFLHDNCASQVGGRWFWRARLRGTADEFERSVAQQETLWVDRIETFGKELVEKRGVVLDSFVHDHGWDDPDLVWQFHKGFPRGLTAARRAAERYRSAVGIWLSPFGGYTGRALRVEAGQRQGFETTKVGLSLAGPTYFNRFRDACLGMVRDYRVNYFKFDGFADGNNKNGAGAYPGDVEALLSLCEDLRRLEPSVFLNPTTGTWPSPFWLLWADAIWRQHSDNGFLGKGSNRQQWITYRDNAIYHGTVQRGPWYPMANLMLHGIIIHKMPFKNPFDPKEPPVTLDPVDLLADIRSYFATGSCMPELHIDATVMTNQTWDALAEAVKWARSNVDVLADTHWIGGDPSRGEVYGWAAWCPRKATLALRNASDQPASLTLDAGGIFELPAGAPGRYVLKSPWKSDASKPPVTISAGRPHEFRLLPFEVAVWDCVPETKSAPGARE